MKTWSKVEETAEHNCTSACIVLEAPAAVEVLRSVTLGRAPDTFRSPAINKDSIAIFRSSPLPEVLILEQSAQLEPRVGELLLDLESTSLS